MSPTSFCSMLFLPLGNTKTFTYFEGVEDIFSNNSPKSKKDGLKLWILYSQMNPRDGISDNRAEKVSQTLVSSWKNLPGTP